MNRRTLRLLCMILLAGAVSAAGQTPSGTAKPSTPPASNPASASQNPAAGTASTSSAASAEEPGSLLPAETPVLTINGICDVAPTGAVKSPARPPAATKPGAPHANSSSASLASAPGNCKTQITRAEFDKLMKAVAPSAPASARRQIASRYVTVLAEANEGVKLGVDKDPAFSEQLALMRLQLLAQNAGRKLQADASNVTDADSKAYYDQNPSAFDEVTLTRIFVPRGVNPTPIPSGQEQPLPAPDSEAIAKAARGQLASGTDPDKVEKSVYEQLKNTSEPPTTKFGNRRRGSLPPAHEQKVFSAKAGEVTDIIPDSVGYVIYRVDSKQELPFEQVKDEAKRRITKQRLDDLQQHITSSSKADYNDAYFGPESPASPPASPRGLQPSAAAPGHSPVPVAPAAAPVQPPSQPTTPKR